MTPAFPTDGLRERLDKLRIPLVLVTLFLFYAAGQLSDLRPLVARLVLFGVPLVALLYSSVALFDTHPRLKQAGLLLAALSFAAVVWTGVAVFQPRQSIAEVQLDVESSREIELGQFTARQDFELAVWGKLERGESGRLRLRFSRGSGAQAVEEQLEHTFNRVVNQAAGRNGEPQRARALPWRFHVDLPGSGPVRAQILHADNNLKRPTKLQIFSVATHPRLSPWLLGAVWLGAAGVQVLMTRRGIRSNLGVGVAIALVYAVTAPHLMDPVDPYAGVFGLILAAFFAAIGSFILGLLFARLFKAGRSPGGALSGQSKAS